MRIKLQGVQQMVDGNAGREDLNDENHDEKQHAPAGAYSLWPNEIRAPRPLARRCPGHGLYVFRSRSAFPLLMKSVHGVPLLTAVARAAKAVPRTLV
jgi:hypothetical protein